MITAYYCDCEIFSTLKEARKIAIKREWEISLISIQMDKISGELRADYYVTLESYNPQSGKMEIINTVKEAKIKLLQQIK